LEEPPPQGANAIRGQAVSNKRFFTTAGSESERGQAVSDKRFFTHYIMEKQRNAALYPVPRQS